MRGNVSGAISGSYDNNKNSSNASSDISDSSRIDIKSTDLSRSFGFIDYNDSATSSSPLPIVANQWTSIPNDGLGGFTNKEYSPSVVSDVMDSQGRISGSDLNLGDDLLIRNDFGVNPNQNNALLKFRYLLGSGIDEYKLSTNIGRLDDGSGKYYDYSLTTSYIYMGDLNTLDNPITLQVYLSTDGFLINRGSVLKILSGAHKSL